MNIPINIKLRHLFYCIYMYFSSSIAQTDLSGWVYDKKSNESLAYVNIQFVNSNYGTLTNEFGHFTISNNSFNEKDSILIQHIGYQTQKLSVNDLYKNNKVYLEEDIFQLTEIVLLASSPNINSIIDSVLKYKSNNYNELQINALAFTRDRYINNIEKIELEKKKTNIDVIDTDLMNNFRDKLPRESYFYRDFLGRIYINQLEGNSDTSLKINAIKTVELNTKEIDELKYFNSVFDSLFSNTNQDEYWKVKSGIIGRNIDYSYGNEVDSLPDSTISAQTNLKYFKSNLKNKFEVTDIGNTTYWEFIHKSKNYDYTYIGTVFIEGEEVCVIDFSPRKKGVYEGRFFVNLNDYAIIKSDFKYAKERFGRNLSLMGLGYKERDFSLSIAFEKKHINYEVKYFSYSQTRDVSFNRAISLQKRKERFLFDKKIHELKVDLNLIISSSNTFEYLTIDSKPLSTKEFNLYVEEKILDVIYVDQFDNSLWEGYPIIQPTEKMKQYKSKPKLF